MLQVTQLEMTVFLENSVDDITKFAGNRTDTSAMMFALRNLYLKFYVLDLFNQHTELEGKTVTAESNTKGC